jgi:hypothetical protein
LTEGGMEFSYYVTLNISYQDETKEVLVTYGQLEEYLTTNFITESRLEPPTRKEVFKTLNKSEDTLFFDSTNIFFYFSHCEVLPSTFQDSISHLSTKDIIDVYFENDFKLKKEILSEKQITSIIYTLAKRKEPVLRVSLKEDVFYGKILTRDWEKNNRRIYGKQK